MNTWGRWGAQDERGALNYITPEQMVRAAGLVRCGRVYPLALPVQQHKVPVFPGRAPALHFMTMDGGDYAAGQKAKGGFQYTDDYLMLACHAGTHMDALAHVCSEGVMYNGFPASEVRSYGARRGGIDKVGAIFTRGVMLDVAALHAVPHLAAHHEVTAADLDACCRAQGISVGPGDAVLLRTGWLTVYPQDPNGFEREQPGIGLGTVDWFAERQVSMIAADNTAVEKVPARHGEEHFPVHIRLLRDLGIHLMELLDLEALARDGVHEFLFVAAPLRITGGVGSPLTPLALV
jgi:kynurenine formamidase